METNGAKSIHVIFRAANSGRTLGSMVGAKREASDCGDVEFAFFAVAFKNANFLSDSPNLVTPIRSWAPAYAGVTWGGRLGSSGSHHRRPGALPDQAALKKKALSFRALKPYPGKFTRLDAYDL